MLLKVVKEILLLPIYLVSGILGYFVTLGSVSSSGKQIIVFVHGWMTQNPIFFWLKSYLESRGFCVYMTNFGWELGDIRESAEKLNDYVESRHLNDLILIGASEGGVISLAYLQTCDGWRKVKRFISIGAPFKGSYLAYLAFFSKAAMQMRVGSKFLKEIREKSGIPYEKMVCISAKRDELVPRWSSCLDGCRHEIVDCFGHLNLQVSTEMQRLLVDIASE